MGKRVWSRCSVSGSDLGGGGISLKEASRETAQRAKRRTPSLRVIPIKKGNWSHVGDEEMFLCIPARCAFRGNSYFFQLSGRDHTQFLHLRAIYSQLFTERLTRFLISDHPSSRKHNDCMNNAATPSSRSGTSFVAMPVASSVISPCSAMKVAGMI